MSSDHWSVRTLVGFGLMAMAVLIVGQYGVLSQLQSELKTSRQQIRTNEERAEAAREATTRVNQLSIDRHRQAEMDSQARYEKAVKLQQEILKEWSEWRAKFAKQNPEIVVPRSKSDKK